MKLSWSKSIAAAGFLFLSAGAWAQVTRPTTVYCFNNRLEADASSRGFNAAAKGWIFAQLGMLGPNGEPPTVNAAGEVVNSAGTVVGSVITNAAGQTLGYRNLDGTKEAYDLDSTFTMSNAWQRVADGGTVVVAKHGTVSRNPQGAITGTGITLDGGRGYPGFIPTGGSGPGTGSGGAPYPLPPRNGAGITLDLNGCYTSLDPDGAGPRRSVAGTAAGVPGVGGTRGNEGPIYKGGYSLVGPADELPRALSALRRCAFLNGFATFGGGLLPQGDIGGWLNSMTFEQQWQALRDCLMAFPNVTPQFNTSKNTDAQGQCPRASGGQFCNYYLPIQLILPASPEPQIMRYSPSPDHSFVEVFFPPMSMPQLAPIQIQPMSLMSVPPPAPEMIPWAPIVSIARYDGQPYNHAPAQVQFNFLASPSPRPALFRLVGNQWLPLQAQINPEGFVQFQIQGPIIVGLFGAFRLPPCGADYNQDGGIDGDDVIAFFNDWDQGDIAADYNNDGGVDGDDVIAFFNDWDSQCGD